MIAGTIRLQPRAIELMAEALEVPPETFLEYQVFRITEALEAHPEICPYVYRTGSRGRASWTSCRLDKTLRAVFALRQG